ncbi:linoleate diol synthase precursor [Podospora didyma]|uniref:Linoleate diol synthase n=1 Tax=Podospora didyma TaxID=330526 RepID=A0AAE0NB54_9PEZI|nr:linoleate diol synthase precursor [Podospora didyma]
MTTKQSKLSSLNQAIKKAFLREAKYPSPPENVAPQTAPDLIGDIKAMGFKDYKTLLQFLNAAMTGTADDNDLLLENLIRLLAKLPPSSSEGKQLTDGLLTQLWASLDHPPTTSLDAKIKYRAADGSENNTHDPSLGAANSPYARTVPPLTIQPPNQPDPSAIFDSLMSRGDTFEPHPQGISSMLFYLATIIIHDIFQTSSTDYNVNLTSSYLDLSPLYGRNEKEQNEMRTFQNGLLKPDCFSSKRILGFPPGCSVFLIMLNRFHNYVVTQLAQINENNRFPKPPSDPETSKSAWAKYDNDLFQTGRLVTCGLYANIILKDYVRTILALNRTSSTWDLDPRSNAGKNLFSQPSPQGIGNQGKDPNSAKLEDMLRALGKFDSSIPADPSTRNIGNLTRQEDGTYSDTALVSILRDSIEDIAGSFGANRVPDCLKAIEVLGIMQARYWNVATLNEFRAFTGLTRHATFGDVNPDPVVARKLKDLYGSPDAVELYPGLVAEKAKPPMSPGSGLCVNYTTSRAILSDAVSLIRGDRFIRVIIRPRKLPTGEKRYNEVNADLEVDLGHVSSKLIFRAFPNHFAQNSIYAHFPFVIPSENKKIHDGLGTAHKYSWDPPHFKGKMLVIRSHKTALSVLSNSKDFAVTWGESILHDTHPAGRDYGKSFCLAGDGHANTANREHITKALYAPRNWACEIQTSCETKTAQLLAKYSTPFVTPEGEKVTREVDVVRDILGLATTHVMAALFDLPLKTAQHPHGIYSEQEMSGVLFTIFASIFYDADVANSFKLRETAQELTQQLGGLLVAKIKAGKLGDLAEKVVDRLHHATHADGNGTASGANGANGNGSLRPEPKLSGFGETLVNHIVRQEGGSAEKAVWGSLLMVACAGTGNQTQLLSQCLDYYLGTKGGETHLPELYRLANLHTKEADDTLMKYMLEGCRLRGTVALYRDVVTDQTLTDYAPCKASSNGFRPIPVEKPEVKTLHLKAGTRLFVDVTTASHDPAAFPDLESVRLDRPLDSYLHYGWGPHQCLGAQMSRVMMTGIFKAVVGRKGLQRVAGPRGELKSFLATVWNGQVGREAGHVAEWSGLRAYMTADQRAYWPIPTTLRVRYED